MGYGFANDDDCYVCMEYGLHCGVGLHGMGRVCIGHWRIYRLDIFPMAIYVYLNPREPPDELDLPYLAYPLIL